MDGTRLITWVGSVMFGAVVAVAWSAPAGAQSVQKCQGRDGQVRYQSAACAHGERTLETWEAVPDPEPVRRAAAQVERAPRSRRSSPRPRRARSPAFASAEPAFDSCAAAKAYRDAVERRVGLARTYELLSALSRQVYDACK